MNALMTIMVRVNSANALAQLRAVEAQSKRTAVGVGGIGRQASWGLPYISKWGNQVQWAGRQLMYNFTLPIALATAAGTKFALDNEKAMVRVQKVYGDASKTFRRLAKTEIPALADAFEALSNQFGVTQSQVINIAGDWAAAGASGIALAKSVKLTLETMILGELEAVDATKQLIAIQAQYGFNTTQLAHTIDVLNMVENQTGASMRDLMDSMARSAGVARVAGIDIEHLAAMTAALVPAAGSAASAGNALKTIISRILSPTTDAVDLMREMGIAVDATSWTSQSATQRIEALSKEFDNLSSAQKTHMATVLGSRWQLNRLVILMQAVRRENSYYNKSLESTSDKQAIFNQRQRELNQVLTSNPQRIKQAWVILQNAMANVIVPLLPYITYLASEVARLANWFASLEGEWQKLALAGLAFLAIIGPVARYVGAVANLFGLLSGAVHFFAVHLGLMRVQTKLATGEIVLMRKGLLALIFTMLAAPFKWMIAGFTGVGKAIGAVAKFIIPALIASFGSIFAPFTGLLGTMLAAWKMFTARALIAWKVFTEAVTLLWANFSKRMVVVQQIMWSTIQAVWAAGVAATMAIWASARNGFLLIGQAFQYAMIRLWWALQLAMQRIQVAGGIMLTATQKLIHGTMIAAQVLFTTIMSKLWFAMTTVAKAAMTATLLFSKAFGANLIKIGIGVLAFYGRMGAALLAAFTNPWVLAIAAIIALVLMFRDEIEKVWGQIVEAISGSAAWAGIVNFYNQLVKEISDAFWALPESVRNAMLAVLTVVRDAAIQVYEWMSYLNPFARHSPSLVEQVKAGMDEIGKQYQRAVGFGVNFAKGQKKMEDAIAKQEAVVGRWERALDGANTILDYQTAKLDRLQQSLDAVTAKYQRHADAIDRLSQAPIKGMQAMGDQIFRNEMKQKKLRLEMLRWEEVNGSIDDMVNKLQGLQGELELLHGQARELVAAGAGSEILGPINQQIAALQAQADAVAGTIENNPADKMQKRMEELQRQGEILQLQNDIKYDPMIRSIDQLANAQKELRYDQIIKGIKGHQQAMKDLEPTMDKMTQAVRRQEAAVEAATKLRDRVQKHYERENDLLDLMRDKYNKVTEAARKAEEAKKAAAGGSPSGRSALSNSLETFRAGKGANWPDPGGKAKIGREIGMKDQSALIEQFTQDTIADMNSIFGGFDMFGPLKEWWTRTWDWIKKNVGPVVRTIGGGIAKAWGAVGDALSGSSGNKAITNFVDIIVDVFRTLKKWGSRIWQLLGPDIKRIVEAFRDFGRQIVDKVGPELEKFKDLLEPAGRALKNIWRMAKPVIALFGGALLAVFKVVASVFSHTIGPVLENIGNMLKNVIRAVRGFFEIVIGILTLDGGMLKQGFQDLFGGLFFGIVDLLKGAGKIIWGVVKGIFVGLWELGKWLYDVFFGHSIIPDFVNAFFEWFGMLIDIVKWLWNNVIKPIYRLFVDLWKKWVKPALKLWWSGIKAEWEILKKVAKWVWDNVLKPVWERIKDLWNNYVKPGLKAWWEGIKTVWSILKKVAGWVWDNVLKPVFIKAKELWTNYVKPAFQGWWEGIKTVWNSLTSLGKWVWDNVMKPVYEKIKEGWQKVRDWLSGAKDLLTNPVKSIVNVVISAINALIKGLNKISDVLPGIDWEINYIEKLASGGNIPKRRVGAGFKTNGARAIVGEGKSNYPEWVIPSDPRFRDRAKVLLTAAASRIGMVATPGTSLRGAYGDTSSDMRKVLAAKVGAMNGIPAYGLGGIIGDYVGDIVGKGKDAWGWAEGKTRAVASMAYKPFEVLAKHLMSEVSWTYAKDLGYYAIEKVGNWVRAADEVYAEKAASMGIIGGPKVSRAQAWARSQVGKPYIWGGVGPDGYDCSGFMSALTNVLRGRSPYSRVGSTATFPWGGFAPGYSKLGFTIGSTSSYAGGVGHMAGTLGGLNVESRGGQGVVVGSAARGYNDPGFNEIAHLASLAHGAIIRKTRGGVLARIGEGRYDEAVTPLPPGWRSQVMGNNGGGGDTYINIDTVEMPNIKSGDDAQTFLKNLEILSKG